MTATRPVQGLSKDGPEAGVPSLRQPESASAIFSHPPGHAAVHPELRRSASTCRSSHAPQAGQPRAPRAPVAGGPRPAHVSTSSDAGAWGVGPDPIFSQAVRTTESVTCPQPMWGATGRGSFPWGPHDPGPELQKAPPGVGPPPTREPPRTWHRSPLSRMPGQARLLCT